MIEMTYVYVPMVFITRMALYLLGSKMKEEHATLTSLFWPLVMAVVSILTIIVIPFRFIVMINTYLISQCEKLDKLLT